MNTTLLVIVLLLGVALLALEIVALPGGIAGTFGIGLIIFGVWQTYLLFGNTVGTIVLISAIALCALMLAWLIKTKTWRRFSLQEENTGKANQLQHTLQPGTRGVTISRLAPSGKALINGQPTEVHAVNKFIDPDRPIQIVAIEGYRIDVAECSDNRFEN